MRLSRWFVLALLFLFPVASLYPRTRAVDRPGEEPTPPRLVSFSGQLTHVAGKGTVGVTFAIYKEAEGGTPLWIETQNVEVDENGQFTVNLGAATEGGIWLDLFTSGEARWLSIQRIPEVEQRRILLASVAYALKAADAETLGGKPLSSFILADETNSVVQKDGTHTLKPKVNTSGTTNYIGKFTDSTNLGNSILYDTGSAVGLLTTSPSAPLHINSVITYRGVFLGSLQTGAFPGVMFENTTTGTSGLISENNGLVFFTRGNSSSFVGSDQRMIITSTGRVGIATNSPQGPLHVGAVTTYRNLNLGSIQTGAYPGILLENTATNASVALTESNGLTIYTKGSSTPFADTDLRLIMTTAGDVGIGVNPPTQKLDVAGNIYASGNVMAGGNLALPATSSSAAGVITLGGTAFVHSFGGVSNTFVGNSAGNFMSNAGGNTGNGGGALSDNTGGSNTGSGWLALRYNTTGSHNTAFGAWAAKSNSVGNNNTAVGDGALQNNMTGSYNIAIGWNAGTSISGGDNNIAISNTGGSESNTIRIGSTTVSPVHTRAFVAGIRGVTTGSADAVNVVIDSTGQLGTVSSSRRYKFDINDMAGATDGLTRLRPVTFRYLAHGDNAPLQYGLIAEEVAEIYPEMVARNKDGQIDTVMYQFLAPMLLNELQKEHRRNEEQRRTIDSLTTTLQEFGQRLEALEKGRVSTAQ